MIDLAREHHRHAADPRRYSSPSASAIWSARSISADFRSASAPCCSSAWRIGAFAPKAQIIGPIGLTGLIMFLYGIGILYGRQFFEGMTGAAGRKYNLLALVACRRRACWSRSGLGQGVRHQDRPHARHLRRLDDEHRDAAGGARCHEEQRSVDRLFDRLSVRRDRPDPVHLFHDAAGAAEISAQRRSASIWARSRSAASCAGRTLDELSKDLPDGVQVTMVRKGDQNVVPSADLVLAPGDGLHGRRRSARRRSPRPRQQARTTGAGPDRQGSLGARLHPRLRRQGEHGRAFRSRSCRCRPAFRRICCMSGATTWTSCRRPT